MGTSRAAAGSAPVPPRTVRRRRGALLGLLFAASSALLVLNANHGGQASSAAGSLVGEPPALSLLRLAPPRVGIQVGHLDSRLHPDELAGLRFSTGGSSGDLTEIEVNSQVADALKEQLERAGIRVDLLAATVPPRYHADLLVALHADSSSDPTRSGYKSAHFQPARNRLEPLLKAQLDRAYLELSGLSDDDDNVTGSMLRYYAFDHRRYRHSTSPRTPAVILELGYISNPRDRAFLAKPDAVALAIASGIIGYLQERGRLPGS